MVRSRSAKNESRKLTMSKATISREAAIQGLLSLGVNVQWNNVNPDVFQISVIEDPVGAGERLTAFLNNGCRPVASSTETPSVPEGQKWTEKDGVIYFTLPATDGRTGKEWKASLKSQGKRISDAAEVVLDSADFVPTTGVVYKVAAIRGTFWKKDSQRLTKNIEAEGASRGWLKLQPEAVCLIREYFGDLELEAMGLWWIVGIHKPIVAYGYQHFLGSDRDGLGDWLGADWAYPVNGWSGLGAFAFGLPQENQS
jgi:hypothetical protein